MAFGNLKASGTIRIGIFDSSNRIAGGQLLVGAIFKLVQKSDPKTYFETHQENFSLGKSEKCEIVLPDPDVADIQARATEVGQ